MAAKSADLEHRALRLKCIGRRESSQFLADRFVINMRCLAALIAHKIDAIVAFPRMRIGKIGVGAFDLDREIGGNEQVEDAVHAVGGNPLAPRLGEIVSNQIGRGRPFVSRKLDEHILAHIGPLFTRFDKRFLRLSDKGLTGCMTVRMIVRAFHG